MLLEPAETRPSPNFPKSRVPSAKLNTDVTILMPDTDYVGQNWPQLKKRSHTYQHHANGNHTIAHFRGIDKTIHNPA